MSRRKQSKVDSAIEAAYYRLHGGRTIDVMKICDLYRYARERIAGGASVDLVVSEACDIYCNPLGSDQTESGCSMTVESL